MRYDDLPPACDFLGHNFHHGKCIRCGKEELIPQSDSVDCQSSPVRGENQPFQAGTVSEG
jgi:hypothetical protein